MNRKQIIEKAYGDCEGPLGFRMPSALAAIAEAAIKALPEDIRTEFSTTIGGQKVAGYRRLAVVSSQETLDENNERTDKALIMAESVDRDREVVKADGCNWREFKTNPQVTWNHDYYSLPVGKCMYVVRNKASEPKNNGWVAKTRYHSKPEGWDGDWFVDALWGLISTGSLPAKSIGFIPTSMRPVTEKDLKLRPDMAEARLVIDKALILEYAVGVIPVNPDALQTAVEKMRTKGVKGLDHVRSEMGVVIPGGEPGLILPEADVEPAAAKMVPSATRTLTLPSVAEQVRKSLDSTDVSQAVKKGFDYACGRIT